MEKHHLGPQNSLGCLGTEKLLKIVSFKNNCFEPVGQGVWPLISSWIDHPPLGINCLHCVECPHQMRKFLLNLALGEPLALV
jgi:hypothetical protein